MIKSLFSFLIICFLLYKTGTGKEFRSLGVPYIQNFEKSKYLAGNQNWSITVDERGIMYFGNSKGLLSFDRHFWKLHTLPNNVIVRAVASDQKGKVYTGGFGEFGFWQYDKKGILIYTSLKNLVPKSYVLNDEIWKIYIDDNRVLFQSFGAILIYEAGKISVIRENNPFLFLHKTGNRFFIEEIESGLHELLNNNLIAVKGNELLKNKEILTVLPFNKTTLLIGTSKDGLFLYDGNSVKPWDVSGNNFLKNAQLNNGVKIGENYFAFGTILNGVVILDADGDIIQHINKSSGLQNNTVLSLFLDNDNNLWAGLDNGIDRVELNSPLSFYFDKAGTFGTVYSSIIYKGKIYLGTNQGLFESNWNINAKRQDFSFKLIPNSQGQVWDLAIINDELFCGHNAGTFKVNGSSLTKVSSVNGGWTLKKLPLLGGKLIQGTYTGLVIYDKDKNGNYNFSHKVEGFGEPSRYVEQDIRGNIWVSQAYKGVFKINLSGDLKRVEKLKNYNENDGLPSNYSINLFNIDGKIVFSSDYGFYVYDDITDRFKPYEELNKPLGSFSSSNKVIMARESVFWFINNGKVALVDFQEAGKIKIDSNQFNILNGRMVQDYENISKINADLYLISVDDGFVLYDRKGKSTKTTPPAVFIGEVSDITTSKLIITQSGSLSNDIQIKPSQNNIRISYALPYYRQAKIEYQYYLDGYSKEWSAWSIETEKDFTNLTFGNYTFKVRARINEIDITPETIFSFEILPPFYATLWAFIFYIIIFFLVIYVVRQWYFKKLEKHQAELKNQLLLEREEELKKEAQANEQRLIKLKNEKLQSELASKSRAVTNSAMNIVYKNELLQKIKDQISNLKDDQGKKLSQDQLIKIQKVIDQGMNDDRDWNLFETSFNETHENFFKKLKQNHPDLVPNDLKLCAYLRMNMSSKEMASLLNISLRGVEIRRYRLRKKLDIPHDKNLVEFLMEL